MPFSYAWSANQDQASKLKQQQSDILRVRGGSRKPGPPRSVVAQPGNGKILLTWNADPANDPSCRSRIYVDTESSLYAETIAGVHRIEVPTTGGATPPKRNLFISFVTPLGSESRKISLQSSAATQADGDPPPGDPSPPVGWARELTGGSFNRRIPKTLLGAR